MRRLSTRNLALSSMFLALGLLLPMLTAQIPSLGNKLLPMHIPVLLCGFVCGWPYGLAVGLIAPVLRSLLFGMPPMFPVAIAMSFELATYGLVAGYLYRLLPRKSSSVYLALIPAMLVGRIIWGGASYLLFGLNGAAFTWKVFLSGAFVNAVPGIVLQIFLVPAIIITLAQSNLLGNEW